MKRAPSVIQSQLTRRDLALATLLAVGLGTLFGCLSAGLSLWLTFVPGLLCSWGLLLWMYRARTALPSPRRFLPLFMGLLAVQCLHFAEEYLTGFRIQFPLLYGGAPYSAELFVVFNMAAYALFSVACLLSLHTRLRFLLLPVLFFVVYGAIGNAISHSLWSLLAGRYFPGLYTAQLYWVMGPLALQGLLGRWRATLVFIGLWGALLTALLTHFTPS
ncbi:MAG: HXXEE domain-containing protein [Inhella sp.]